MNKKVNIYPSAPITGINPPIRSAVRNVTKTDKEIRICILERAIVEEVLSNGKTLNLDLNNYNKENNVKEIKIPEVKNPVNTQQVKPEVKQNKIVNTEKSYELSDKSPKNENKEVKDVELDNKIINEKSNKTEEVKQNNTQSAKPEVKQQSNTQPIKPEVKQSVNNNQQQTNKNNK